MRKLFPVAALVAVSLALVGCVVPPAGTNTNPPAQTGTGSGDTTNQNNTGIEVGGGSAKSQYWPTNIPTIEGAYGFTYAKASNIYYLGYKVQSDKTAKEVAAVINAQLTAAGWTLPANNLLESDDAVVASLTSGGDQLTMSVGKVANTTNTYSIAIISGPKSAK